MTPRSMGLFCIGHLYNIGPATQVVNARINEEMKCDWLAYFFFVMYLVHSYYNLTTGAVVVWSQVHGKRLERGHHLIKGHPLKKGFGSTAYGPYLWRMRSGRNSDDVLRKKS